MGERRFIAIVSCVLAMAVVVSTPAAAVELRVDTPVLGQVREGYLSNETEAPIELWGDLGVSDIRHGTTLDVYFRLQEDFAQWEGESDFYAGVLRVPKAVPWLDVQLGRQIISQAPGTIYDADSGQIRVTPEGPLAFTVFGGQPRYWEPTYGAAVISQDEQIFGGAVRTTGLPGGTAGVSYLQQFRQGSVLQQLVSFTGTRSFNRLPGLPNLYGSFQLDATRPNIDQIRAGMQSFVLPPKLMLNLEGGYYKPQNGGNVVVTNLDKREDTIFQLFSVSEMLQFRGGARYNLTRTVSSFADVSYQRYQSVAGNYVNGYIWGAGVLYLPGGDGLEVVNVEYFGTDSAGGNVNGVRGSYENRVYDRILFRAMADVAYYEKPSNQFGTAVASLIGVGYILLPGLAAEVNFVANRNQLFTEDFRFGFFITYNARYRTKPAPDVGLRQSWNADQQRPWPWGLAEFGPAAWGPTADRWGSSPNSWGLSPSGWSAGPGAALDVQPNGGGNQ
jgi:hypothetical protein